MIDNSMNSSQEDSSLGFKIPDGLFDNLPESEEQVAEDTRAAQGDPPEKATEASDEPASAGENATAEMLGKLAASGMLAKIPEIISAAKPIMEIMNEIRHENEKPTDARNVREGTGGVFCSAETGNVRVHRHVPIEKRTALLVALKPYMNKRRCRTIDMMVSVGKLSTLLGSGISADKK